MAWKDSQRKLDLEDQEHFQRSTQASGTFGGGLLGYALAGVAVVILSGGIMYWLLDRAKDGNSMQLQAVRGRLTDLEQRIDALEGENGRLAALNEQNQRVELYMRRFEKLEISVARRMDHMSDRIDSLKKAPPPPAPSSKAAVSPTGATIHIVAKGETLYSISRQYDMSVGQLLTLNQLPENAVIQPGQQLKVGEKTR